VKANPELVRAAGKAGLTTTKRAKALGVDPAALHIAAGHIFDRVDRTALDARLLREAASPADEFDPDRIEAHAARSEEVEAQRVRAKQDESDVVKWLRAAVKGKTGDDRANALYEVQKRIEAEKPPTPADWGGTMSFMGTGELGRWLGRTVLDGIPRAVKGAIRGMGKENRVQIMRGGRPTGVSMRLVDGNPDIWAEEAPIRVLAGLGKLSPLGGHHVLTPDLIQRFNFATANHTDVFVAIKRLLWSNLQPGDEKWLEPGSERSRSVAARAQGLESKPLSPDGERVVEAVKRTYDQLWPILAEHERTMGRKEPGRVPGYGGPLVQLGGFAGSVRELVRELHDDKPLAPAQMGEITNRFLLHREGATLARLDAGRDFDDYAHAAAKKIAYDPFLTEYTKTLNGLPVGDPRREAMLQWGREQMFPRYNEANSLADRGARFVLFSKLNSGLQKLSRAQAAAWTGKDLLREHPNSDFVWVKDGQSAVLPNDSWHAVGSANKGTVYAGVGGEMRNMTSPELRPVWQTFAKARAELSARSRVLSDALFGREADLPQARQVAYQRMLDDVATMSKRPMDAALRMFSTGALNALVGYNLKTVALHLGNIALTTMPEYLLNDPGALAEGTGRFGHAAFNRSARTAINWLEAKGHLSPEQATRFRKMTPLMAEEVLGRALGSTGSDIEYASRGPRGSAVIPDATGARAKALDLLKPTGLLHSAIPFVRGWDAAIHVAHGRRAGLSADMIGKTYEWSEAAEQQLRTQLAREAMQSGTATGYASVMWPKTIPDYGRLGRAGYMSSQLGRTMTQFGLFGKELLLNNTVRPASGFVRSAFPDASPQQAWDARVFTAQVALGGAALAAGEALRANLAWMASPAQNVALAKLLTALFPDNKRFKDWNQTMGEAGGHAGARVFESRPGENRVISFVKGFLGPIPNGVIDMGEPQGKNKQGFNWQAIENMVENVSGVPVGAARKAVRENPEVVGVGKGGEAPPATVAALHHLGVKSTMPELSPRERLLDQLGMLEEKRRQQATRRLR